MDKFSYDQQRVGFYWNDDPECKKEFGLEEDKDYVLMLNGINSMESHIDLSEVNIDPDELMLSINI